MAAPIRTYSNAKKGIGTYLEMDNGLSPLGYDAIGDLTDLSITGAKFDENDVTHFLSPTDVNGNVAKEIQFGVYDPGSVDVTINFTMLTNQDKLLSAQGARKTFNVCMPQLVVAGTYPSGVKLTFSGLVNNVVPSPSIKGVITAKFNIRVTGPFTYAALT